MPDQIHEIVFQKFFFKTENRKLTRFRYSVEFPIAVQIPHIAPGV